MRRLDEHELEAEIARLDGLGLPELRERWRKLYGNPAPVSLRRDLLIRAIAYQLQVKTFGGLSATTKRKLREIAAAAREGTFGPALIGPRIRPGTRLVRVWREETHSVLVLEDGFEWKDERYSSLSTIAKAITGTNWNGWTFFGVKRGTGSEHRHPTGRFKRPPAAPDGSRPWPRSRRGQAGAAAETGGADA